VDGLRPPGRTALAKRRYRMRCGDGVQLKPMLGVKPFLISRSASGCEASDRSLRAIDLNKRPPVVTFHVSASGNDNSAKAASSVISSCIATTVTGAVADA